MTVFQTVALWLAGALIGAGFLALVVGLYAAICISDLYTRLRVVGEAALLGLVLFLAAFVVATGDPTIVWDPAIVYRIVPIGVLLLLTTPVAARIIRRATRQRGEKAETPGVVDESSKRCDREGEPE